MMVWGEGSQGVRYEGNRCEGLTSRERREGSEAMNDGKRPGVHDIVLFRKCRAGGAKKGR